MCLILIAWRSHPRWPLVLAANRDEFYARPARAAQFWSDAPDILGGRDVERGGTWLAVDRRGRIGAVANFREPTLQKTGAKSRGFLVGDFLRGDVWPGDYLGEVARNRRDYDPFNLLLGDGGSLWFLGHGEAAPRTLGPGLYGISNGVLDCPWPKVKRGKLGFQHLLGAQGADSGEGETLINGLFSLLADRTLPGDGDLPDTGVGIEWERRLSSLFVHAEDYGTRCSTVIHRDASGRVQMHERSFNANGEPAGDVRHVFHVAGRG